MRRTRLLPVLGLAVLAACAGHEKLGDRAAAVGDWKIAERQYAEALRSDPENGEKRAKYQQARQQALHAAVAAARACQVSRDWECAFAESDYAARLEPGSAEYASMRAAAGREAALLRLRRAQDAAARRDHHAAFDLYTRGRDASADATVQAEAARIAPALVAGAVSDAQQRRAAQQYPEAVALLTLAAGVDGRVRPTLDEVRGEHARWLDAQYEAATQAGDALLRERRFAEAQARYEAALQHRRGGRAEPLARYARALAQGEVSVQRRDWTAATTAYQEAVRTGMDTGGFAAAELDRVRIRPYALRLRSVLVKPIRPDGAPWAGGRSRGFDRMVGLLATAAFEPRGGRAVHTALEVYDALPHENRPSLFASLTLPDGRQYATPSQKAIRARFESFVVLDTNHYDDRPVSIRIGHADPAGAIEVGMVTFRPVDLLSGGEISLSDRSVVELRLVAEASPLHDGDAQGFAPIVAGPTPPADPPPARRDRHRR